MRAIEFEGYNVILGKPDAMTDEQCLPLHAYRDIDTDGFPFILSVWQPSKEDIEAINAGRPVLLKICGQIMPPVALFTTNEIGQANV